MRDFVKDLPVPHDNGMWISEKVSRIVEMIRDYDQNLDVKYCPPNMRQPGEPAFIIVERNAEGQEFEAFYVNSEDEFDERVLAKIYNADNLHGDVQQWMEAQNRAARDVKRKEFEDAIGQAHDEARFLWRTPLHTVRLNGKKLHL